MAPSAPPGSGRRLRADHTLGAWTKAQGMGVGVPMAPGRQRRRLEGRGEQPYDSSYRPCLTGLLAGQRRSRSESV